MMKKSLIAAGFVLALSACQAAPPVAVTPDLSYAALPKINLNVARIDVVDSYRPPMKEPNVEHLFRQSPASVAKAMIAQQLVANGSSGTLRITIADASVIHRDIPVTQGFMGTFKDEESDGYKGRVSLRFELIPDSDPGRVDAHATVTSERDKTLLEDTSPAERDMAFFNMDEEIMRDLETGFTGVVQRTFGWK